MASDLLLSVVATSRNDNHGKNLHYRMQQFVNGFVEQCKRHHLKAELILVEWNPPDNTKPLSQALNFPKDKGPCSIRIVTVPKEIHMRLDHSDKISLFQMIGKNVGIRRAKGKFVLATNIDIIFSDALMSFIKKKLKTGHLYRVDRLDVPETLPESAFYDEILNYCARNVLRINGKSGTMFVKKRPLLKRIIAYLHEQTKFSFQFDFSPKRFFTTVYNSTIKECVHKAPIFLLHSALTPIKLVKRRIWKIGYKIKKMTKILISCLFPNHALFPHTNACGDFTLLSLEDWFNLKGYPEWNIFSWHLDSIFVYQALQHGIIEKDLPRRMSIYHIEHEAGSGYSPEYAHLLFKRLDEKKIPYIDDTALNNLLSNLKMSKEHVVYNDNKWGMSHLALKEVEV